MSEIEIEGFRAEFVRSEKGVFFKFYQFGCAYSPIAWVCLNNTIIKENNQHTLSFKKDFYTHEFTFIKFYGDMYTMEYRQELWHILSLGTSKGLLTSKTKEELIQQFETYC